MKKSLAISAILLFAALAGIGYALTPPPPPPPVPQNLGIYDTGIDQLITSATDQSACRSCHQTTGTNVSGGYNNTIGGVPTRHHNLLPEGVINPLTGIGFQCQDCHPSTPGVGMGILLDRSCTDCHNGTSFTTSGARVGNFSRPHHVNTTYDDANIGNPAAARQCNFCHGSFVNNYNDGHYKPSYATDFMITPFASFKVTNTSQPTGLAEEPNKVWGGCYSCHVSNPNASPMAIDNNEETHHKEIHGFSRFGGTTIWQNASTPFVLDPSANEKDCYVCHVVLTTSSSPYRFNVTNPFTGELLVKAMEVRNSTIEAASAIEFASANGNITFNGTGCEKCHGVQSLHNIQYNYQQNGPQGLGHINNDSDCSGCHNSWLPAAEWVPGALVPTLDSVSPSVITAGTATTLTITGLNFVNDPYTSVVSVDGTKYTPMAITDSQITVNIPALSAGVHQLQLVKGGDTLSKLVTLTAVSSPTITSATLSLAKNGQGTLTITGTGLGSKPATNSQMYVSVNHAGNQITSSSVQKWSNTQITAKISNVAKGDVVTVLTTNAGEAKANLK